MKSSHKQNFIAAAFIVLLAMVAGSFVGCACYTIQPVPPTRSGSWGDNTNREGYIFYEPELYFLVTSAVPTPKADAAPVLNVTPVYLPNPNKPYRVSTHNFLAKSDFTFNFKDGWQLTSIDDKADNSSVTTALAGQMKTLLDAATKSLTATDQPLPKIFLLHPEFDAAAIITNIVPVNCKNFLTE
jgi:hypothetical protein